VPQNQSQIRIGYGVALFATLLAAAVLWLYRDVASPALALRLLLPALWLGIWSVSCIGAGAWPVRWLVGKRAAPDTVIVALTGAAVLAAVGSLLAILGLLRPIVLLAVLGAALIEGLRLVTLRRHPLRLPEFSVVSAPGVLLIGVGSLTLALLTAPPVMYDALNYHLAFPAQWLQAGGFEEFPRHLFSYYPSSHGLLYTFALVAIGPWAAQAIHWWMALAAVVTAAHLGQRASGRRGALWAAACFALTPAALEVAGYAIADMAVAAWAGAAILVLLGDQDGHLNWRTAALAGVLVGSAAAAKYLALATVIMPVTAAGCVLLWRGWKLNRSRSLKIAAAFAIAVLLILLPWLGRNAVWTGNPLYPYLQTALGGPPCDRDIAAEIGRYVPADRSLPGWILASVGALVVRTLEPLREGGLLGPIWLVLLPVSLLTRGLDRRVAAALWASTVTGLLVWGSLVQYARFLLPVLVPAAGLAGAAAAGLTGHASRPLRTAFQALLVAVLAWNATVLASDLNLDRLRVVTGHQSQQQYLGRWVSYAPAIDVVNRELPGSARLLLVGEARSFYLDRRVLIEDPYRTPLLVELARGCDSVAELTARVQALGASHLLVNRRDMARMASQRGATDYWQGATARERSVIESFLNEVAQPLAGSEGVWVGVVPTFESSPSPDPSPN
jgi:hypothetical protein